MKKETIELIIRIVTAVLTVLAGGFGGAVTASACTLAGIY